MAELIKGLDAGVVKANYERIQADVGAGVRILAAIKYVDTPELGILREAGITLVGENRQQALAEKQDAWPDGFEWHFIGQLQSRKVKLLVGHVTLIHSVASESALTQVAKHADADTQILLEVNVAQDDAKAGFAPADLPHALELAQGRAIGLMTMPPFAADPEDSRRHFAHLKALADANELRELSMGTSQDYRVAAEEGATIVRIGSSLYR